MNNVLDLSCLALKTHQEIFFLLIINHGKKKRKDMIGLNGVYLHIHNLTFILAQNPLYYITKKSTDLQREKIFSELRNIKYS